MTAFGAFIGVVLEVSLHLLAARASDEDWGHGMEPNVEKRSTVLDHPRIRRVNVLALFFHARGIPNLTVFDFQDGRYPMVAKVRHARPFPTEPGIFPGKIGGPGLINSSYPILMLTE